MDGIEYVHMNNIYGGQVGDGSFVYPDDSYFGGIASLVEPVFILGAMIAGSAGCEPLDSGSREYQVTG